MGLCIESCRGRAEDDDDEVITPNRETMRELQAKAAENRIKENEARGLKDPEHVKRMQAKKKELEERQEHAAMEHGGGGGLKWQVN